MVTPRTYYEVWWHDYEGEFNTRTFKDYAEEDYDDAKAFFDGLQDASAIDGTLMEIKIPSEYGSRELAIYSRDMGYRWFDTTKA